MGRFWIWVEKGRDVEEEEEEEYVYSRSMSKRDEGGWERERALLRIGRGSMSRRKKQEGRRIFRCCQEHDTGLSNRRLISFA